MTTETLTPSQPTQTAAPASAAAPEDWARALLERQLWILGQLAEGGLEIARALERQATGAGSGEGQEAIHANIPMAYSRVARAVRMTILLQSKLIGEMQTIQAKAAHEAAHAHCLRGTQRVGLVHTQKARIGRIVGRIAWTDANDNGKADRMEREAVELLDQDELYGDVLTRPVSEIIAHICRDLGLEPDWPQLAEEAWAQAEIKSRRAGAPLAGLGPTPAPVILGLVPRIQGSAAEPDPDLSRRRTSGP